MVRIERDIMPNIKKISDKSVPTPSFAIGNSHIDVVDINAKYLGVQLDKHLVWDEHTKAVRSKITRSSGVLGLIQQGGQNAEMAPPH